jgi:hypothetical protein
MFWVMNIHDENVRLRIDSDKQGIYTWIWLIVYSDGWYKETDFSCLAFVFVSKIWTSTTSPLYHGLRWYLYMHSLL